VNVRPIAAYRRTQRSSLQLGLRVGGHLALTDFRPEDHSELSHMAGAVDDSTINIVVVIITIIIMPCRTRAVLRHFGHYYRSFNLRARIMISQGVTLSYPTIPTSSGRQDHPPCNALNRIQRVSDSDNAFSTVCNGLMRRSLSLYTLYGPIVTVYTALQRLSGAETQGHFLPN